MPDTDPLSGGAELSRGERLTIAGYKAGSRLANLLPERAVGPISSVGGAIGALAMGPKRQMLERHLRRVDPLLSGKALRRASREGFTSYTRYWLESFRLPHLSAQVVTDGLFVEGYEHVAAGLDAGKGVIIALPHLGGWEWAGRWLSDRKIPVTVVVEAVRPLELFDWFVELRESLGMHVVALGPNAGQEVMRALRNNEVVCLLSDRDIGGGGIEVEFFGERTTLPGGPATISLRTGAPILPTAVYFDRGHRHIGHVDPALSIERTGKLRPDVTALTQVLAHSLEGLVRRAPQQWHLMQPNWPSDDARSAR